MVIGHIMWYIVYPKHFYFMDRIVNKTCCYKLNAWPYILYISYLLPVIIFLICLLLNQLLIFNLLIFKFLFKKKSVEVDDVI